MEFDLELRNFRCFEDSRPATLEFREGLTAFVGPNNAGKSSLLRAAYELRRCFRRDFASRRALSHGDEGKHPFADLSGTGLHEVGELFCDNNDRDLSVRISWRQREGSRVPCVASMEIFGGRPGPGYFGMWSIRSRFFPTDPSFPPSASDSTEENGVLVSTKTQEPIADFRDAFAVLGDLESVMYIPPFRHAVSVGGGSSEEYFDVAAGSLFFRRFREWQTGAKENARALSRAIEQTREIFSLRELQVTAAEQTLQLSVDGRPYKLSELGSGLAQFLMILSQAAIKKPSYILIDEPEAHLHPALQLRFVAALASHARVGLMFSTHSIGLARASGARIMSVTREGTRSRIAPFARTPNYPEFLGELSFSAFQEIGFDTLLLVEGVNDVLAVGQLLRLLKKDSRVVVLPLGGAAMINGERAQELGELKRIAGSVFALIDSEKAGANEPLDASRKAFLDVCQRLGIGAHVLERRAIENYLPDSAIKQVYGDGFRALHPYELLRHAQPSWSKNANWKILAALQSLDEIRETDLVKFLGELAPQKGASGEPKNARGAAKKTAKRRTKRKK